MNLPIRYAHFPFPLQDAFGDLIPSEELIASWLWAKSELLGWRPKVHWLWSSRGSLTGLDSTGSVINVGIDRGTTPDPFEKFAAAMKSAAMIHDWSAEALREKWLKCSVPDRFDRDVLRRFQRVYCTSVAPLLCSASYRQGVKRSLDLREATGDPAPVFFGFVASSRPDFRLPQKAWKNLVSLQKQVGEKRVALRTISATIGSRGVRVQCRTPDNTQPGRPATTH